MQIYIRRDDEDFGPYSREAALEYLKCGIFETIDKACYAGVSEWKTVGELLGIDAAPKSRRTRFATAKKSHHKPASAQRASGAGRRWMMTLNVIILLLVATAAWVRLGDGARVIRHCLAAMPVDLARLANTGPDHIATPASPHSVVDKPPVNAPASAAAPRTASNASPKKFPVPRLAVVTPVVPPTPVPVAAAPAARVLAPAQPKPFDLADLAGNPAAWPKTLTLKQAVTFPAVYESQVVGSVTAPPGTVVNLVNIQGDQLTLDYQGGTQSIPWRLTDIEEAMKGGLLASATPSAAGTSAAGARGGY